MKLYLYSIFVTLLLCRCHTSTISDEKLSLMIQAIDSLKAEIHTLKYSTSSDSALSNFDSKKTTNNNSSNITSIASSTSTINVSNLNRVKKVTNDSVKPKQINKTAPIKNDTLVYYYKNSKQKSVVITPRKDNQWLIILFNKVGQITYQIENVIKSYSSTSEIKHFHENGAVSQITSSMNPGASMYMYHSTTYFNEDNHPTYQETSQTPANSLDDYKRYDWDNEKKVWVQKKYGQ